MTSAVRVVDPVIDEGAVGRLDVEDEQATARVMRANGIRRKYTFFTISSSATSVPFAAAEMGAISGQGGPAGQVFHGAA